MRRGGGGAARRAGAKPAHPGRRGHTATGRRRRLLTPGEPPGRGTHAEGVVVRSLQGGPSVRGTCQPLRVRPRLGPVRGKSRDGWIASCEARGRARWGAAAAQVAPARFPAAAEGRAHGQVRSCCSSREMAPGLATACESGAETVSGPRRPQASRGCFLEFPGEEGEAAGCPGCPGARGRGTRSCPQGAARAPTFSSSPPFSH